MTNLNVGAETIKLFEENVNVNLGSGNDFLDAIARAYAIKNKLISQTSKLKTSVFQKTPLRR